MRYYEVRFADGETRAWPGSNGEQASRNAEAATGVAVTAWRQAHRWTCREAA